MSFEYQRKFIGYPFDISIKLQSKFWWNYHGKFNKIQMEIHLKTVEISMKYRKNTFEIQLLFQWNNNGIFNEILMEINGNQVEIKNGNSLEIQFIFQWNNKGHYDEITMEISMIYWWQTFEVKFKL